MSADGTPTPFEDSEIGCVYDDGTVCICRVCPRGLCDNGPGWQCILPPEDPECPVLAPNIGEECSVDGIACDYGDPCVSGALRICRLGVWHPRSYSCDSSG